MFFLTRAQPMYIPRTQSRPGWSHAGFTLVEMIVVIAIIVILMTIGSMGLKGMGGKGVTAGVATAESLFDEARSTAVGRNVRSCVLVSKSVTNNPAEDLRRLIVAYEETNDDGTPVDPGNDAPNWVLSNKAVVLPEQTFFSSEFSKLDHETGTGTIDEIDDSRIVDVKDSYQGTYYIYEFNNQGICKTPGASFIIGSGSRNSSQPAEDQPPKVTAAARRDFGGFVIWRSGRTSVFRSPDQMGSGVTNAQPGDTF